MVNDRIVLRTASNLSFVGEVCASKLNDGEKGILLKPSRNSGVKIWCPEQEVQCIILKDGQVLEGDDLKNELGL